VRWELLTADRKVVAWDGQDAEDAARRFVDSERVAGRVSVVVASRRPSAAGTVSVLGRGEIIG
jgi:hypothetical protein